MHACSWCSHCRDNENGLHALLASRAFMLFSNCDFKSRKKSSQLSSTAVPLLTACLIMGMVHDGTAAASRRTIFASSSSSRIQTCEVEVPTTEGGATTASGCEREQAEKSRRRRAGGGEVSDRRAGRGEQAEESRRRRAGGGEQAEEESRRANGGEQAEESRRAGGGELPRVRHCPRPGPRAKACRAYL